MFIRVKSMLFKYAEIANIWCQEAKMVNLLFGNQMDGHKLGQWSKNLF